MKAFFPVVIWLVWVMLLGPDFRQNQWECLLIMFAAIELVPRGLQLSIPNMKIWHGTINTLGFAWLSLLGYKHISNNFSPLA